jgi:hypothetical protein
MKIFISLLIIIFGNLISAQIKIDFTVIDSLDRQPISSITIALERENNPPIFKYTDEKGKAIFIIDGKAAGVFRILGMTYSEKNIKVEDIQGNSSITILLEPKIEALDEISIEYKRPVTVKQDTIVFNADAFAQGNERKLKDLIKRIPGLDVDNNGNVKLNGKDITRLFVEGKLFFTGDEKLGVNNIPADAIEELQLLDNFTDVAMHKKFEDTDELIMNVILKEDKKNLFFGDITAGIGHESRYVANPSLFYFSPEYSLNSITDLNNTGRKSFTFKDYLDINGGIRSMSPGNYFKLGNDDFAQFLKNELNEDASNNLTTLNYRKSWQKTDVNSYLIFNQSSLDNRDGTINRFLSENPFNEERTNRSSTNLSFLIGKISLEHKPNKKVDLRSTLFFKTTTSDAGSSIQSLSPFQNTFSHNRSQLEGFNLELDNQATFELNKKNSLVTQFKLVANESTPSQEWRTNRPVSSSSLNYVDELPFQVVQEQQVFDYRFSSYLKHYFTIDDKQQLHSTVVFNRYVSFPKNRTV